MQQYKQQNNRIKFKLKLKTNLYSAIKSEDSEAEYIIQYMHHRY